MVVPDTQSTIICSVHRPLPFFVGPNYGPGGIEYREEVYTRRYARLGTEEISYFAAVSATDKKAFEMVTNYLLRGSRKI